MIAAWMTYCVVLGTLVVGAAVLAERAIAALGGPIRRVWGLAVAAALILPVAGVVLRGSDLPEDVMFGATEAAVSPVMVAMVEGVDGLARLDGGLLDAWAGGSLLLLAGFLAAGLLTRVQGRRWERAEVDGTSVLISDQVGPAVVGFLPGRVVLPRWALASPAEERRMMLRHEQEHLNAGDPHLLLLGIAALVAMPWNVPLWYMVRRLKLAVEVDCDARVLRSGELDVGAYGSLLLSVGRRRSAAAYPSAAFSRPRSVLWHRIERMTRPPTPGDRMRAVGLLAAVVVVLMGAWFVPQPVRAADASLILAPCPETDAAPAHKA